MSRRPPRSDAAQSAGRDQAPAGRDMNDGAHLSPPVRAAFVEVARLLGRQAAREQMSQGE